jgi:hypothetical protein
MVSPQFEFSLNHIFTARDRSVTRCGACLAMWFFSALSEPQKKPFGQDSQIALLRRENHGVSI